MTDRDLFPEEFPAIPLDEVDLAPAMPGSSDAATYERLVLAAFSAAVVVLLTKIAAVLLIANLVGATITIQFFLGFLPYFGIIADPRTFTSIVTFSAIAMVTAGLILLIKPVLQEGWDRQTIWGRGIGLAIAAETFLLEIIRHFLWPDVLRWDWAWLGGFELLLGVILLLAALKQSETTTDKHHSAPRAPVDNTEEIR